MNDGLMRPIFVLVLAAGCLLAEEVLHRVLRRVGKRIRTVGIVARHTHRPAALLATLSGLAMGGSLFLPPWPWRDPALHAGMLLIIAVSAWLITRVLFVIQETALSRYRVDVEDNRRARTVHTQVRLIRRVTAAIIAIMALGAMLVTFPAARTAGASLLASAGLLGAVAAFAAQSMLGNVIAGLQIAFAGALRLDDVVIVEDEWGWIEEIALTHVVVRIWDDRRLILPTSYFTTKPFENWTRTGSDLLGSAELDVDRTLPVDRVRKQLDAILADSALWDGRVNVLHVTDATGANVRLRALVSARDGPTLWNLRCEVREQLVTWLNTQHASALPQTRAQTSLTMRPAGED